MDKHSVQHNRTSNHQVGDGQVGFLMAGVVEEVGADSVESNASLVSCTNT